MSKSMLSVTAKVTLSITTEVPYYAGWDENYDPMLQKIFQAMPAEAEIDASDIEIQHIQEYTECDMKED